MYSNLKTLLSNWNFFRFVRLGLGIFVLVQGIMMGDKFSILLGALFSLMPLFNVGCCGVGGCDVNYNNSKPDDLTTKEITYEEVADKK